MTNIEELINISEQRSVSSLKAKSKVNTNRNSTQEDVSHPQITVSQTHKNKNFLIDLTKFWNRSSALSSGTVKIFNQTM